MGAWVGGGGPFKRDGAPSSVANLNRTSACFLRITCLAPCKAMDRLIHGDAPSIFFAIPPSWDCLQKDRIFPRFAARHLITALSIPEVTVPKAWMVSGETGSDLAKSTEPKSFVARCCFLPNAHDLRN